VKRLEERLVLLEAAAPLHDLLRFVLGVPESGRVDPLLYVCELLFEPGTLKDTSAVPPRAGSGLRVV
jgi:hypothetical protein